jgi:uncharacterized membrane protein
LTGYLSTERLRTFADSVLLVAITILAYNLIPPSIVNGQLQEEETQSFFDNLYGLVSSFVVIFIFWLLYMRILDYLRRPNEVVMILSLSFFILVLLTPVFTLGTLQYNNFRALIFLAVLQIINGILLLMIWIYILKNSELLVERPKSGELNNMYSNFVLIPSLYAISIVIGFVSVRVATIFPVIMIPIILMIGKVYRKKE